MFSSKNPVSELRFWIGIILTVATMIVTITYWGARLEGRMDVFAVEMKNIDFRMTQNDSHDKTITDSVNTLYDRVARGGH